MYHHEQPSPATSNATNRTNRGGRPKEWTPPRARRLTRLYCYTNLRVDEILKVLEDEFWTPGKEAANKHLNNLLGKDPRWMRPRDVGEQRQRIAGLKSSSRGRSSSQPDSINKNSQSPLGPDHAFQPFTRTETLYNKSFGRSSSSSLEKIDTFMFGQPPTGTTTTNYNAPPPARQTTGLRNLNNPSYSSFTRLIPGIGRQGTSMTTSTNFSVGSTKEAYYSLKQKLNEVNNYQKADVKDIFRLLKRWTISNEDVEHSVGSPSSATEGFRQPMMTNFRGQTEGVTSDGIAKFLLPGDFIGPPEDMYESKTGIDQFGNTTYHYFAASNMHKENLVAMISQECTATSPLLNATNTGGQTFVHVLHDEWFSDGSYLIELIKRLRTTQFNFQAADAYGRTFFHVLRQNLKPDSELMRGVTSQFGGNMALLNRRDAFGVKPMILRASTIPTNREEARPSLLTIPGATDGYQQRIQEQQRLLKIITSVNASPSGYINEDSQGRNALHCLAEVILGMASVEAHASGTKAAKRKMDDNDEPSLLQTCSLNQRLQYLETVLLAHVDVNHYNASGDTVLVSFISHIIDGQDDKDLELLIKRLISAGANLEARNRRGETVLQVAARLGQKFAVKVLLEQGANVYVHNSDGRSVLETVDHETMLSATDAEQLARLEATRSVITGRFSKSPALQQPTPIEEWSVRSTPSTKMA